MGMVEQGCLVMCRRLVLVLNSIADKMEGAHRLTIEDEGLLALAQGWTHATTHSIFFYYRCLTHRHAALLHTCMRALLPRRWQTRAIGHAHDSLQGQMETLHARLGAACL